jgi:ribonuclease HI
MINIYTDGGSRGNPGKAACAFIVVSKYDKIIKEEAKSLGVKTNNEAEYIAIISALTFMQEKEINMFSDSELVVRQLNGEYAVRQGHLQALKHEVDKLRENRNIKFSHVKRDNEFITRADELVNEVLDKEEES